MKKMKELKEKLTNKELIGKTIERLVEEGYLSQKRASVLRNSLPDKIKKSEYVLHNLAVHLGIQAIFAFDIIPIPIGTISRFSWALGNRIYYTIKNNKEKKDIHSYKVLFVSAIPFIGWIAYTIPLKQESEDLCYVYANHVTYLRKNKSLESYLENKPRFIREPLRKFLIPKDLREKGKSEE